jgi:hypothetical protein
MAILLLVAGLTGMTMIIVRGAIFERFRGWLLEQRPNDLGYLFTCCQCMGFWIGLLGGIIYAEIGTSILYAGAVSLLSLLAEKWLLTTIEQITA